MALGVLNENRLSDSPENWDSMNDEPSSMFRYKGRALYAIAARTRSSEDANTFDQRDLGIIPSCVSELLQAIDVEKDGRVTTVNMGVISAGSGAPWHPVHPFAQMLRGIKNFLSSCPRRVRTINVHVVDPKIWATVESNKIRLRELLSSDLATHRLELWASDGDLETYSLTAKESPRLDDLLRQCGIDKARWSRLIIPKPKTAGDTLDDMVLAPTMIIRLTAEGE
jgi:hypothetical protein